jgi:hypothetical protein
VTEIYNIPGLMDLMLEALEGSQLRDEMPLAWLLCTLTSKVGSWQATAPASVHASMLQAGCASPMLSYVSMQVEQARQDPTIIKMIEPLEKVGGQASRHAHELRVITSGASTASDRPMVALGDMMSGPGGRHDNDKVDFRSISIQPTANEVSMHG